MRTTMAIDEDLVDELMRVEPGISRSAAIVCGQVLQDCLVAAVALRRKLLLHANNTDFDEIPSLKRYRP